MMDSSSNASKKPSPAPASGSNTGFTSKIISLSDIGCDVSINIQKHYITHINTLFNWTMTNETPPMAFSSPLRRADLIPLKSDERGGYFVSEKTRGTRMLCFLSRNGPGAYVFNELYQFRYIPMFCPLRMDRMGEEFARAAALDSSKSILHDNTILDGELIYMGENEKPAFVVFDALAINGREVVSLKLPERLKLIQNHVMAPRKDIPLPANHPPEPITMYLQAWYPMASHLSTVLRSLTPKLSRGMTSGLFFVPMTSRYTPGRNPRWFEWRPTRAMTAYFQLRVEWRSIPPRPGYKLMVMDRRTPIFHDEITFSPEHYEHFRLDKKATTRLLECCFDPEWFTFIPSRDKNDGWTRGNPMIPDQGRGVGWRKGGWRFLRTSRDVRGPSDKLTLEMLEQALGDRVSVLDIEAKASARSVAQETAVAQAKAATLAANERLLTLKRKREATTTPGSIGVCFDFQNSGECKRGAKCFFSHCACNTNCVCTSASDTFGIRPKKSDEMSDTASDTLITSSLPLPLTSGNVENTLLLSSQGKTLRTSLEAPLATVSRTLETMTAAHMTESASSPDHSPARSPPPNATSPLDVFQSLSTDARRLRFQTTDVSRVWASVGLDPSSHHALLRNSHHGRASGYHLSLVKHTTSGKPDSTDIQIVERPKIKHQG